MQVKLKRQKRCKACQELFQPDSRTKGKQKYCSKAECQNSRQRQNEKDWRKRNPDCLAYQYEQTRQWNKAHPDYSRQRRAKDPQLLKNNRRLTRNCMKKIRAKKRFDKSKVILTQVVGENKDKCYLMWLHVGLTKASPLSRQGSLSDNCREFKRVANCLPRGGQ